MNKITIFLSEGENHVRQAIRLSLEHIEGVILIGEARNAESLLAQITQVHPDFLLLDWHLPGLNPQRTLSVIKQFCPETKIIATVLLKKLGKLALAYGVYAFLLKSLPPDEFINVLKDHLNINN